MARDLRQDERLALAFARLAQASPVEFTDLLHSLQVEANNAARAAVLHDNPNLQIAVGRARAWFEVHEAARTCRETYQKLREAKLV